MTICFFLKREKIIQKAISNIKVLKSMIYSFIELNPITGRNINFENNFLINESNSW